MEYGPFNLAGLERALSARPSITWNPWGFWVRLPVGSGLAASRFPGQARRGTDIMSIETSDAQQAKYVPTGMALRILARTEDSTQST